MSENTTSGSTASQFASDVRFAEEALAEARKSLAARTIGDTAQEELSTQVTQLEELLRISKANAAAAAAASRS